MNTAEILEKCQTLPGVTVHMQPNCAELRLSTDGGTERMCFLPLFPGITLALIEVHAPSWPAPEPDRPTPDAKGPSSSTTASGAGASWSSTTAAAFFSPPARFP